MVPLRIGRFWNGRNSSMDWGGAHIPILWIVFVATFPWAKMSLPIMMMVMMKTINIASGKMTVHCKNLLYLHHCKKLITFSILPRHCRIAVVYWPDCDITSDVVVVSEQWLTATACCWCCCPLYSPRVRAPGHVELSALGWNHWWAESISRPVIGRQLLVLHSDWLKPFPDHLWLQQLRHP